MKQRLLGFRRQLGRVFDDDLGTAQWYNIADWVIVFMIILSSVEIFMATFEWPGPVARILDFVNDITLWFFVAEVSLRIWAAPEQSRRYRGFTGRIKYCCTFYGFIDFISTYPFIIQFFVPLPLTALKILRTARIIRVLRITRYAKSFNLLSDTIKEKRNELIVSMQFLVVITFILSLMLFVFEHDAQPDVYDDGVRPVVWAFAQYIGDPGQMGDTPPVTLPGKIIACIVGLLGIAIFAVPAGILGAGFTEAIENERKKVEVENDARRLRGVFERKLDRPTGFQAVPPFRTLCDIKSSLNIKDDNIVDAIYHGPGFRMVNLASTIPADRMPADRLAVEHYPQNRPYGYCVDRGSAVTVISPSSMIDAGVGWFAYYVALIGGFNYISRETGERTPYRSFYAYKDENIEGLADYNADLLRLMDRSGEWGVAILAASGALEPEYDTQVHLGIGGSKGDTHMAGDGLFVHDEVAYRTFYSDLANTLADEFGMAVDHQKYHSTAAATHFARRLPLRGDANIVVMRIEWHRILWNPRRLLLAKAIARVVARDLAHAGIPDQPVLKTKQIGFDGYDA